MDLSNASTRDSLFEEVASQFGKTLAERCFSSIGCILIRRNITPLNQSKYRQAFRIYERNCDTALMEYCIAAGVARTCEILEDICRKLNVPEVKCP